MPNKYKTLFPKNDYLSSFNWISALKNGFRPLGFIVFLTKAQAEALVRLQKKGCANSKAATGKHSISSQD